MLKLKELRFCNVGRFIEPQTIRFDILGNLVQVDAENLNTNGSSGSGKSTIFNAFEYLLGLNDIPTTVLQSRLTKEGIAVSADFYWDGTPLTISRSKSSGLSLNINGEIFSGSSKQTEEKLDMVLAMPRKLFRPMLHKRQKEGGFFLNLTPKEMHEFLMDCLGLSGLRTKIELLDSLIKGYTEDKTELEGKLASANAAYNATNEAMLSLGIAPMPDMHPEVVEKLNERYKASMKVLNDLELNQRLQLADLQNQMPTAMFGSYDRTLIKSMQEKIEETVREINRLHANEKQRQHSVYAQISALKLEASQSEHAVTMGKAASNGVQKLASEIKKLRDSMCPTCEQTWITEKAKEKEQELMTTLLSMKESIILGVEAENRVASIKATIEQLSQSALPIEPPGIQAQQAIEQRLRGLVQEELQKEKTFLSTKQAEYDENMRKFNSQRQAIVSSQAALIEQARGQAEVNRMAYDAANNKLELYKNKKQTYSDTMANLVTQLKGYNSQVETFEGKLVLVKRKLAVAEESKRLVKSFASVSFEKALSSISDTSTRIIRSIPNMANATIQLEGLKETKDGKVKEEVNAVISMDGDIGIPIKSLSGGERSTVDLAVDLAAIDLIESETGKGIDIFILDEPFTGLDTACIEMALEVLKNSNSNKRLIIVDHNPEAKEMVSNRIVVVRDGQTSKLQKIA